VIGAAIDDPRTAERSLPDHIFISYAEEDLELARRLGEYLKSRGWNVWWDRNIPVGHAFDEVIEEALRAARCAVVIWSRPAVASRWDGVALDVLANLS